MTLKIDLIEHPLLKDFYQVPSRPELYVSRDGIVFDTVIGDYAEKRPSEYIRIVDGGKHVHLHRLLAETFIERLEGEDFGQQEVNHKDGNKWNNDLSNLEWVTVSGNSLHAYRTGLRSDNRRVEAKDLRTGETKCFFSLRDCADYFNTTATRIYLCLKEDRCKMIHFNHYVLKDAENKWPEVDELIAAHSRPSEIKEILVIEEGIPKRLIVFGSIRTAGEYLGVSRDLITRKLKIAKNNDLDYTTVNKKTVMYFSDYKSELNNVEFRRLKRKSNNWAKRKPTPIEVTQLKSGDIKKYSSVEEFAKQFNISKNTIQKHILVNKGIWRKDYMVKYLTSPIQQ